MLSNEPHRLSTGKLLANIVRPRPKMASASRMTGPLVATVQGRPGRPRRVQDSMHARPASWPAGPRAWPGRAVRISAQAHLQRFYGSLGFVAVSDEYLEDDIPHIEMLYSPPAVHADI